MEKKVAIGVLSTAVVHTRTQSALLQDLKDHLSPEERKPLAIQLATSIDALSTIVELIVQDHPELDPWILDGD
ncbi:MAG: hypothetical protein AAFQ77_03660 [Myxococcota bacterium]